MPVSKESVLKVVRLTEKAILPKRGSSLSAGLDLSACESCVVPSGSKRLVKTGLRVELPTDTYGRVAPRSGLASKHMIDVGAGVVDADYRGELMVLLFNHGDNDFVVREGDRIAQLVCEKIERPQVLEVNDLDDTERGDGGFGSTGK